MRREEKKKTYRTYCRPQSPTREPTKWANSDDLRGGHSQDGERSAAKKRDGGMIEGGGSGVSWGVGVGEGVRRMPCQRGKK